MAIDSHTNERKKVPKKTRPLRVKVESSVRNLNKRFKNPVFPIKTRVFLLPLFYTSLSSCRVVTRVLWWLYYYFVTILFYYPLRNLQRQTDKVTRESLTFIRAFQNTYNFILFFSSIKYKPLILAQDHHYFNRIVITKQLYG